MNNKEIQEQRIKGYFIQATKGILKGEGLKHVSVRNIAEKAGYSYATLYNYFRDAKDLIFECVKDFQEECTEFIFTPTVKKLKGIEKIKEISKRYVLYFIEYPGIFELFFIEKTSEIENKQNTTDLIVSYYDRLCADEWEYIKTQNKINTEKLELIKQNLKFSIAGMLLFYNHRKYPANYKEFINEVENQVNLILEKL